MAVLAIGTPEDGGSIQTIVTTATSARVLLVPEPYTEHTDKKSHSQWFYFSVSNTNKAAITVEVTNAGSSSFSPAWQGYTVCASYDQKQWFRVADTYFTRRQSDDGHAVPYDLQRGILGWTLTPTSDTIYFAYFPPFALARQDEMVQRAVDSGVANVRTIGKSLDGRQIQLLEAGSGPVKVWVAARQHPGETQASFFMEGLLQRLADKHDTEVTALLQAATVRILPNLNPDGSFRGHLRTNATGANLNREWCATGNYDAPSAQRSPEVACVLAECDRIGVDLYLDAHGDEECAVNFLADAAGIPGFSKRLEAINNLFSRSFLAATDDFQVGQGYEPDTPAGANLAICANQISSRYDTLGVTLEMPYKDYLTEKSCGPKCFETNTHTRCFALGQRSLTAIKSVVPYLRGDYNEGGDCSAPAVLDTPTRLNAFENMRLVLQNAAQQTNTQFMIGCAVESAAALLYEWLENGAQKQSVEVTASYLQSQVAKDVTSGFDSVVAGLPQSESISASVFVEAYACASGQFTSVTTAVQSLYDTFQVAV